MIDHFISWRMIGIIKYLAPQHPKYMLKNYNISNSVILKNKNGFSPKDKIFGLLVDPHIVIQGFVRDTMKYHYCYS